MKLIGKKIFLVPAKEPDREKIFSWLTQSDLTSSMLGEPNYPDHPIPSWVEFCTDYTSDFFNTSGDGKGRSYISFVISPSVNNKRAIAVYGKAGFETIKTLTKEEQEKEFGLSEYSVNVLMIKSL